jgi:uncharacterized membrane protein YjgN (DUF898 family)
MALNALLPFQFVGSGAEYFRISIVNLFLTLVTFGFYSPWAKVRRTRYFYGSTLLAGSAFGFHASPVALLKGRFFTLGALAILGVTVRLFPSVAAIAPLLVFLATPWLVVRGMRFRLRNTTYRGLSFGFDGRTADACVPYLLDVMLAWLTLGLRTPRAFWSRWSFLVGGARLGCTSFSLEVHRSAFRRAVWGAADVGVVTLILALVCAVGLTGIAWSAGGRFKQAAALLPALAMLCAAGTAYVDLSTAVTNAVWNHVRLGPHRFVSSLESSSMLELHATNLLAIVGTVGLAIPWARVRLARYRAAHLTVVAAGDIGGLANRDGFDDEAFGSEAADALDIAVSL